MKRTTKAKKTEFALDDLGFEAMPFVDLHCSIKTERTDIGWHIWIMNHLIKNCCLLLSSKVPSSCLGCAILPMLNSEYICEFNCMCVKEQWICAILPLVINCLKKDGEKAASLYPKEMVHLIHMEWPGTGWGLQDFLWSIKAWEGWSWDAILEERKKTVFSEQFHGRFYQL